ncbi:MAG: hypothetical protein Q8P67_07720 [archaeon]|nr:hypothetical protein [archaeon]
MTEAQVESEAQVGSAEGPFNYTPYVYSHVDETGDPVSKTTAFFRSLWDPIDSIFLVVFRVLWGAVLAYEGWTYVKHECVSSDSFLSFFI